MKRTFLSIAAISAALVFSSCQSTKVERVASSTVTDYSGYWNDTDVRLVAEEIINDCLSSPNIANFSSKNGRLPVIIVGSFRNKSDEHIDTEILTKKLESSLVNSGVVEFVSSSSEREEIRAERNDQQYNSSEDSAKSLANETGADYMLQGSIKTIVDSVDNKMTRTYYVTTEMVNIETNKKIWMNDNSSIKKIIKKSSVRM